MANHIELITKFSTKAWDKVYKRESISSILDGDNDLVKFVGAKTVRIASYASSGLSDYARPNAQHEGVYGGDGHDTSMTNGGYGYVQGDSAVKWEEFTISCDRGVQLRIELFDDEETDGLAVAMATTEVSRTQVIPEVDAYTFSKIAENAGTVVAQDITIEGLTAGVTAPGAPIYELNKAFLTLAEREVPETDQLIFCSNAFYNSLRNTPELVKTMRQTEYGENVKFTIGTYEGRDIIAVPQNRFRTSIKLLNGGYGWEANSKNINFIVLSKKAVIHVTKYNKVRVFNPAVIQDFDGYKVNVRIYHDVFVPMNKKPAIYVSVSETPYNVAVSSEREITYTYTNATKTISKVVIKPNGDLVGSLYASTADLAIGTKVSADVAQHRGAILADVPTTLANGTYHLYGVEHGMIVAKAKDTFTIA